MKDQKLRELFEEVYGAINEDHRVLAAIGTRTILDISMSKLGAGEAGTFFQKLEELQQGSIIYPLERKILERFTDAGSAAAHRNWKPSHSQLDDLMNGVEAFLHRVFVLEELANRLNSDVPKRPTRARSS